MKKIILLWFLSIVFSAESQITTTFGSIEFNETTVGTKDSITFFVTNHFNYSIQIDTLIFDNIVFDSKLKSFVIPGNDSLPITIYFTPKQNVIYKSLLLLMSKDGKSFPIPIYGIGKYEDIYQNTTFNLYDEDLKIVLNEYVKNHTSLGYKLARQKMFETIDDLGGDTIECVYTGRKIETKSIPDVNTQHFNTEHTWPQETFDSKEPMRSDLYNLYPTDELANSKRANYPFGHVISNITWAVGGSKLGENFLGKIVFEPRDQHKGNVARSIFYFIIRYPQNFGNFIDSTQEDVLRLWNKLDPVDEREQRRNDSISFYQGKRNPFIDHPEFVERIWSFSTSANRPKNPQLDVLPFIENPDTIFANSSTNFKVVLFNFGDTSFQISSVDISNPDFAVTNFPGSVPSHSFGFIDMTVNPKNTGIINGTLRIEGEGKRIEKSINLVAIPSFSFVSEPTTNTTYLTWNNSNRILNVIIDPLFAPANLHIYNIFGQKIFSYDLLTQSNEVQLTNLPNGIFVGIIQKNNKIWYFPFVKTD